jgi:hypothetical protein
MLSEKEYVPEPFYANELMRENAKAEYVRYIREVKLKKQRKELEVELENLIRACEGVEKLTATMRETERVLVLQQHIARMRESTISYAKEFDTLLHISTLTWLEVGAEFLWAVFGPGRGTSLVSEDYVFPETLRVLVSMRTGLVRAWGRKGSSGLPHVSATQIDLIGVPKDTAVRIRKLLVLGSLGEGVRELYEALRGRLFIANSKGEEEFTEHMEQIWEAIAGSYQESFSFA